MIKLLLAYSWAQSFLDKRFMTFSLLKAVMLAAFTWWLCGFSMWLWNRRYQLRLVHHLVCAFAALATLVSTFLFQCLGKAKDNALKDLKHWQSAYLSDLQFDWLTFVEVYERLQQLYRQNGWEWDAQKYPDPPRQSPSDPSKYRVPTDKQEASEMSLGIYCDRAIEHLAIALPVLSQILGKDSQIPVDALRKNLVDFQNANSGAVFNYVTGSLRIAGQICVEKLERGVVKQVFYLRLALVVVFILAQFAAFGFAGHSAYSDVKIHQH